MGRGFNRLRYMLKNAEIAMKGLLTVIPVRTHKEKNRTGEKASIFSKNTKIIMNRMLVEILTIMAIVTRSQTEINIVTK